MVLSLEMHEALRSLYYSNANTQFLINKFFLSIPGQKEIAGKEILNQIKKITQKIKIVPADEICQKELGKKVLAGIYLISLASFEKLIPLKPDSILKAIKKIIPEKYLELNLKAFNLAKKPKFFQFELLIFLIFLQFSHSLFRFERYSQ